MTVSFVSAGILSLSQAISVIMGANIGTTFTAWIMVLGGGSFDLRLVVYATIVLAVALIYTKRNANLGDFLIGLSLDGPEAIHDRFRTDRGGQPTFARVMRGLNLLQQAGVDFNTLTTVNARSEGHGAEIYQFLRSTGSRYLQFLPVAEPGNPPYNVSDLGFGQFLCDIFDVWVRRDVGETFVNQFDAALCCWCGLPPGTCVYARSCGDVLTVEHNGDVYACDHFVDEAHKLGNLGQDSFRAMMANPRRTHFVTDKYNTLPDECRHCPWLPACGGECPQHRFAVGEDGSSGHNALCRGYRLFFEHAAPYLDRMRSLLEAGRAPAEIME